MKHVKLFESWLEDLAIIGDKPGEQSIPDEAKALAAKVDFGSKVVGKDILNPKNNHVSSVPAGAETWDEMIEQKLNKALKGKGLDFEVALKTNNRFFLSIGESFQIRTALTPSNGVFIDLIDKESNTFDVITKEQYYGTNEETSDAIVAAITNPKNLKIFKDLKFIKTPTPLEAEKSKSLEALTNDKIAVSVHKKIKNLNVSDSAESIAHGILIQTLYYGPDGESRRAGIETIVKTLKKYLKDKDYTERMGRKNYQ